jgi:hypothetical protein
MIAFMLQADRAVLRPHLFAMLNLLHLPVEQA